MQSGADVKLIFGAHEGSLEQISNDIKTMLASIGETHMPRIKIGADLTEAKTAVENLHKQIKEMTAAAGGTKGEFSGINSEIKKTAANAKSAADNLRKYAQRQREARKAADQSKEAEAAKNRLLQSSLSTLKQSKAALDRWTAAQKSSKASSREAYETLSRNVDVLNATRQAYNNGTASAEDLARAQDAVKTSMKEAEIALRANGDLTQSFGDKIGGLAKKFSMWFGITRIIMAAVRAIKQMISLSIELDSAFAQLKIVTGATEAEIRQFKETAVDLAKSLGQSVTDVTKSIEVFSRLGYKLPDATELARYATILSNVAAVDISEATTGLTSIIKGFNLDVEDAAHVADVLINVKQKYAVSASEMMEAYE